MQRVRPALAALAAALVVAMAAIGPGVLAQDESAGGEHPILGAWIVDDTPAIAEDALQLYSFHVEGAVRGAAPDGATVGSWEPTGERSADVTLLFHATDPTTGALVGLGTVRASVEVSEDGLSFTGTYTFEPPAALAEALGLPPGEFGPADVTGERITVEPMGQPVAPIPEFPEEPAAPDGSPPAPEASPMAVEASPAPAASPVVLEVSPPAGSLPLPDPGQSPAT